MIPPSHHTRIRLILIAGVVSLLIGGDGLAQNPRNEIEVRVFTPDNRAVDQMPVVLLDDSYSEIVMHYTDAGGHCYFRGLSQGVFYIQLETKGNDYQRPNAFRIQIGDFATSGGEKFLVEIKLIPKQILPGTPPHGAVGNVYHQNVPPDARLAYERALSSLHEDDFAGAERSLRRGIELFPSYYDALDLLGSQYVLRRSYQEALPLLQRASEVNKKGWHAFYSLGVAQCELDRKDEGISALKLAADYNPQSPNINMRLGLELSKNPGTYDEAARAFVKASRLAGKDLPDAYFYLASLYTKQNKYADAAEALESYLAAMPKADAEQKSRYRKAIAQLRLKAAQTHQKARVAGKGSSQ